MLTPQQRTEVAQRFMEEQSRTWTSTGAVLKTDILDAIEAIDTSLQTAPLPNAATLNTSLPVAARRLSPSQQNDLLGKTAQKRIG